MIGSSGQMNVFKDQVRQFPNTIVQLEKKVHTEQEKRVGAQVDLDQLPVQILFQSNNVWSEPLEMSLVVVLLN